MRKLNLYLCILMLIVCFSANGQVNCRVLIHNISDNYEGRCKNGLAHGQGVAKGIDKYEGQFRAGVPHGNGIYTWENGDIYNGKWRNGKRHGKGVFSYYENEELKVLSGIWQNDEYKGVQKTSHYSQGHILNLDRFSVRKVGDGEKVMVNFYFMGRMGQFPHDFVFRTESGYSLREGLTVGYNEMKFPAYILITYTVPDKLGRGLSIPVRFEITINEPGNWEIKLYN